MEREIIALPVRLGGLGIPLPNKESKYEYEASREITNGLKEVIISQKHMETCSKNAIDSAKNLMKMLKGNRSKLLFTVSYSKNWMFQQSEYWRWPKRKVHQAG